MEREREMESVMEVLENYNSNRYTKNKPQPHTRNYTPKNSLFSMQQQLTRLQAGMFFKSRRKV